MVVQSSLRIPVVSRLNTHSYFSKKSECVLVLLRNFSNLKNSSPHKVFSEIHKMPYFATSPTHFKKPPTSLLSLSGAAALIQKLDYNWVRFGSVPTCVTLGTSLIPSVSQQHLKTVFENRTGVKIPLELHLRG